MVYAQPGSEGAVISCQNRYAKAIGSDWVAPVEGRYFDNVQPINGKPFCEIPRADQRVPARRNWLWAGGERSNNDSRRWAHQKQAPQGKYPMKPRQLQSRPGHALIGTPARLLALRANRRAA